MSYKYGEVTFGGRPELIGAHLTVDHYRDSDDVVTPIEPPLQIVFEGESTTSVAVHQGELVALYDTEELRDFGAGDVLLGLHKVARDISKNGNLILGADKPLTKLYNPSELTLTNLLSKENFRNFKGMYSPIFSPVHEGGSAVDFHFNAIPHPDDVISAYVNKLPNENNTGIKALDEKWHIDRFPPTDVNR